MGYDIVEEAKIVLNTFVRNSFKMVNFKAKVRYFQMTNLMDHILGILPLRSNRFR